MPLPVGRLQLLEAANKPDSPLGWPSTDWDYVARRRRLPPDFVEEHRCHASTVSYSALGIGNIRGSILGQYPWTVP